MQMTDEIEKAVTILTNGGLVAFPTETVYGLGADASNPAAIRKIYTAKGRPSEHPLIVHIGDIQQLAQWAVAVSPRALQLAAAFWPGPLTLILKKHPQVSALITGGQETVGVRIPKHPVALQLLKTFQGGLVAPSANRFGRISPTTAEAVREELGANVDLVLDGGQCAVGVESTIVDMTGEQAVILRPGMITATQISAALGEALAERPVTAPRVSGDLESHYAPQTPTVVLPPAELMATATKLAHENKTFGVLSFSPATLSSKHLQWRVMPISAEHYARELYLTLRQLDKLQLQTILVEAIPEGVEWDAVRDRLKRASC